MPSVELAATDSEPLCRTLVNASTGAGITGATVRCDVTRLSDDLVLDFADMTFKAIGAVGTRYRTLAEVDAVNKPGEYKATALDLSTIVGGVAVGAQLKVQYYRVTPNWVMSSDELRVVDRATATALAAVQADTNDIQARLPAALVGGRIDASVGAMAAGVVTASAVATGAIDADALAADAVAEIADGVWDELAAGHVTPTTFGAILGTNLDITLTALPSAVWASAARTLTAFTGAPLASVVGGVWGETVPGAYGAGTAGYNLNARVSLVPGLVWDELTASHVGAGSFGLALGSGGGGAVTVAAGGITAASFAAGAIDAAAIAAGAITSSEAPALAFLDVAVSSRLATASYSAPPSAATVATEVWATAHGTPSANTFGWLLWRLAQWGTEIADKAVVGQQLLLRSPDLATTYATVTLRDVSGGVITPAVGEPARFDP